MRITQNENERVPPGCEIVGIHKNSSKEDKQALVEALKNPQYYLGKTPLIAIDYETYELESNYRDQSIKDFEEVELPLKQKDYDDGLTVTKPKKLKDSFPIDIFGSIVTGISICTNDQTAYYINLAHKDDPACPPLFKQDFSERGKIKTLLEKLFSHCPEGTRFIAHNSVFEERISLAQGWDFLCEGGTRHNPKFHCTLIMSRMLKFTGNSLKNLVQENFYYEQPEFMEFVLLTHFKNPCQSYFQSLGLPEEYAEEVVSNLCRYAKKNGKGFEESMEKRVAKYIAGKYILETPEKDIVSTVNSFLKEAVTKTGTGHATMRDILFYGGQDSWWTLKLFNHLKSRLVEVNLWNYYRAVEAPILPLIAKMGHEGVAVDKDRILSLRSECLRLLKELRGEIKECLVSELEQRFPELKQVSWETESDKNAVSQFLYSRAVELWDQGDDDFENSVIAENSKDWDSLVEWVHTLDPTHPNTLKNIVFRVIGLPVLTFTEKGAPSLAKEACSRYEPYSDTIKKIIDLKRVMQTQSLYAYPYLRLIHPHTGRIHGNLTQSGADTGRFTASNPNLQQVSKKAMREIDDHLKVRDVFIADSSDHVLLAPDFSQVELRITAHYSQDPTMQLAYNGDAWGKFIDIHSLTNNGVFGHMFNLIEDPDEKEKIKKQCRKTAKNLNFLIVYLGTAPTLLSNLRSFGIFDFNLADCEDFIRRWNEMYPGVGQSAQVYIKTEAEPNYCGESFYGRKRYLTFEYYNKDKRRAVNHRIQGTAADVMKITMARLFWSEEFKALEAKILLTIHDELVISIPKKNLKKVIPLIESAYTDFYFDVPIETSLGAGANFGDLDELELLPSGKLDYSQVDKWLGKLDAPKEGHIEPLPIDYFNDRSWVEGGKRALR